MAVFTRLLTLAFVVSTIIPHSLQAGEKPGLQVGKRAPVSVLLFAQGHWAENHTRGCPAAKNGNEPKIAIYTTTLDENVMNLAVAVDAMMKKDPSLKWSFVSISDEKGYRSNLKASDDRYQSKEEFADRLATIREEAKQAGIKNLTFGLTAVPAAKERERTGMPAGKNLIVSFLKGTDAMSRKVHYAKPLNSSELDDETIAKVLSEIDRIRR